MVEFNRFKTEYRNGGAYRYRSDDGGKTWTFVSSLSDSQLEQSALVANEQARIQRELK